MKFNFDHIKNIAKDVSKEVVNVVGDKYLEIKANTNFDDGKYDEVIKAANDILKLDKYNYEIILLKGKALMKQNKYDEAIETFIKASTIDDTKIEPLLHIAAINEIQGNIDDAIDIYNSIIEKEHHNSSALLGLARSYYSKKEYKTVNNYYIKIQSIDIELINDEDYYKWGISLKEMNDFEQAKAKFNRANSLCPSDKYGQAINDIKNEELQPLKDNAYNFFSNEEFNKTIHMFTRLNYASNSILTHEDFYTWGLCLEEVGKDEDALDKYKKAYDKKQCKKYLDKITSIETENTDLLLKEAKKCYNENSSETLKYINKILELDSKNIEALLMKGNVLLRKNNQFAWDYYEKVLELDPSNEKANEMVNFKKEKGINVKIDKYWLEMGIKELNDENYTKAENALNKSLEFNPNNAKAWSWLCVLYQNQKNYRKALDAINESLKIDSKNDQSWFNKGDTLFWMGDFKSSIQCFDKAIRLNPDECEDALAIKGMALVRLNKMSEAEHSLRQCFEINPKNALAIEAIKYMPNFGYNNVFDMDIQAARKINVNPLLFAKVRHTAVLADMARDKGESIHFEYDFKRGCILKHNNKKYFFNFDEIDAATVYVEKIQSDVMWDTMSDESKDKINSIADDVMKELGYKKN